MQCRISLATTAYMPRPFNRRQALENQAFLAALRRTGNARLAARDLGVNRSTFTKRRARDAAFAAEWDAALALAHATLRGTAGAAGGGGAEPRVIRLANGRLQLRAPPRGVPSIDRAARQAFLAALSATANVRLSARAAGFAHSSFYRLRDGGEVPEHLESARPVLPALEQVTGWSKADPAKRPRHPERALFGGWRLEDWQERK